MLNICATPLCIKQKMSIFSRCTKDIITIFWYFFWLLTWKKTLRSFLSRVQSSLYTCMKPLSYKFYDLVVLNKPLRALLAKQPDISLPTFLGTIHFWFHYHPYLSKQYAWPQKLRFRGQNRTPGPDFHFEAKRGDFRLRDVILLGPSMVGLRKKIIL